MEVGIISHLDCGKYSTYDHGSTFNCILESWPTSLLFFQAYLLSDNKKCIHELDKNTAPLLINQ